MNSEKASAESAGYWKKEGAAFAFFYKGRGGPFKALVARFLEARTRLLLSLLEPDPSAALLDVGCGSGVHVKLLAPMFSRAHGVDISEPLLAVAREELAAAGLKNVELSRADAAALPFADASFGAVVSLGLLDYVSPLTRALGELARVAKPGAAVIFTIPKRPSPFVVLRRGPGLWLRRRLFGLPPIGNAVTFQELSALASGAGLSVEAATSLWAAMWVVKARKT